MEKRDLRGIFAKMHLSFVEDGLLADIIGQKRGGSEIGSVIALIIIVKHMDEQGISYPSQALIAQEAGVTERTVGEWVRSLLKYRRNGKPIVTVVKRNNGKGHFNNVYHVQPLSQWSIFRGNVYEEEDGLLDVIGGIG